MSQNLFQEFEEKRRTIKMCAKIALENGWIDATREREIAAKIDNEILTIGVIGQMKCGKSTFINAFVFGDDVLPVATTPMTAALTVVTYNPKEYGPEAKLIAEFYSEDEWEEQKLTAARSLEGVSESEEIKIKAARELVSKSAVLGTNLGSYLGKSQIDDLERLKEYVGADGRYVSITKAVTINYPIEYLKGVEIVDTPGFNDPIVSREERTRQFLKRADAVLLLLYAGRPFDSTDRNILFKNIRECGIGKVLVGVNKYDIPYENGDTPEAICQYVTDQIEASCRAIRDNSLSDLIREAKPILFSSQMALLSQLPMSKIHSDKSRGHDWNRYCDIFEISGQTQMRDASRIDELIESVRRIIAKEKGAILFKKAENELLAAGTTLIANLEQQKRGFDTLLVNLGKNDDELEKTLENVERIKRRLERRIGNLDDDLTIAFRKRQKETDTRVEEEWEKLLGQMSMAVDNWGNLSSKKSIAGQLLNIASKAELAVVKRPLRDASDELVADIKSTVRVFLQDVDFIGDRLPDYTDSVKDFLKRVEAQVNLKVETDFAVFQDLERSFGEFSSFHFHDLRKQLCSPVGPISGLIAGSIVSHNDRTMELQRTIAEFRTGFDSRAITAVLFQKKDEVVKFIRRLFNAEFFDPIEIQLNDCLGEKSVKEKRKVETETSLVSVKSEYARQERQLQEMKDLLRTKMYPHA